VTKQLLITLLFCGVATSAWAQANQNPESLLQNIDVVEQLGKTVPLDLEFRDESGNVVKLGDYFTGEKPVLLNLGYYKCPMLCNMVLNGVVGGMQDMDWVPGEEFTVVTVSIDPREGPKLAREKKATYIKQLGKPEAAKGWHFLTGQRKDIKALAESVGFGYEYDMNRMEYAHGASIFFLSPKGKITRYLYGIEYEAKQLRLALVEAGEGTVGNAIDRFLLRCYHYDPHSRKYGVYVWGVMRAGGLLTLSFIAIMLFVFWRRERRRGYGALPAGPDTTRATPPGGV
jgi:protein SCO1/2